MTKKQKHYTIVCYTFPPSKAIGGRRWAKFSQYLARKGRRVTVITSDLGHDKSWYQSNFENIDFVFLDPKYPDWLEVPNSLIDKLKYRLYTRFISKFIKHNLFDKAYKWEKQILSSLKDIHSNNPIDYLVVTGAPYSIMYYGALFKQKNKEIKLISDFRDPWTWGSYYGLKELPQKKKEFQKFMEEQTMVHSDLVCFPTKEMGEDLAEIYPSFAGKLQVVPHAYDEEKISKIDDQGERSGFIYGGSMYPGIEPYLESLAKVVHDRQDFSWTIFSGSSPTVTGNIFKGGNVHFNGLIDEKDLFKKIKASAAYLAFFPETDKDLISTKFFEIIYLETPIIMIAEEGAVGRFIRENNLGVHILPEEIEKEFPKYLNEKIPFEKGSFDVSKFGFSNVTDELIACCEAL